MKTNQLKYSCAITYGRFCIGHFGHVELIQQCLAHGEYADIHLSGHTKNNDYDIRVLMLKHLCRLKGVDLSRVNFYNSPTVTEAMTYSVGMAPYNECVLVLGSDQITMGTKISEAYDTAFVINRRSTSSTEVRYFLDTSEFIEDLRGLYGGDEFSICLAKILRKEELAREKSEKVAGEIGLVA